MLICAHMMDECMHDSDYAFIARKPFFLKSRHTKQYRCLSSEDNHYFKHLTHNHIKTTAIT